MKLLPCLARPTECSASDARPFANALATEIATALATELTTELDARKRRPGTLPDYQSALARFC